MTRLLAVLRPYLATSALEVLLVQLSAMLATIASGERPIRCHALLLQATIVLLGLQRQQEFLVPQAITAQGVVRTKSHVPRWLESTAQVDLHYLLGLIALLAITALVEAVTDLHVPLPEVTIVQVVVPCQAGHYVQLETIAQVVQQMLPRVMV
jgi:hypothetical protein